MTQEAEDVRSVLASVELPASRVDVERAIGAGRRIRRRRRYAIGATVAGVTAAAVFGTLAGTQLLSAAPIGPDIPAGASPSQTDEVPVTALSCQVSRLELPPGMIIAGAVAADPTGRYVVSTVFVKESFRQPVLWEHGRARLLTVEAVDVEARDVNSAGLVVGAGTRLDRRTQFGWVYLKGKTMPLPALPGYRSAVAVAVNENGDVLGVAFDHLPAAGTANASAAVVWPAGGAGKPYLLPVKAAAWDIGDDGTKVGGIGDGDLPYAWTAGGQGRRLPLPRNTVIGTAMAVRGEWVLGSASPSGHQLAVPSQSSNKVAPSRSSTENEKKREKEIAQRMGAPLVVVRWNLATGDTTTWRDLAGTPAAVNAKGWVLVTPPVPSREPMLLIRGDQVLSIPDSEGAVGYGLSDDGRQVIGMAGGKPTVWTC